MITAKSFWVASCEDKFEGFGLRGFGQTADEAKRVLFAAYLQRVGLSEDPRAGWSDENYEEFVGFWGVIVARFTTGRVYFGSHDDLSEIYGDDLTIEERDDLATMYGEDGS